ncbi:MAG: hypothetical protein Q4F70_05715 [Clostridia bacterium]|nr:hypothetical protein [Clostridia bacterium]
MKIASINEKLLEAYSKDNEMLTKSGRPCGIVVELEYKGEKYNFAIPFRSNISKTTPKNQYFPLPNRESTKPYNHHGLHYIKMFPVTSKYLEGYSIGKGRSNTIKRIIDEHEKEIVTACQEYLYNYENGIRPKYSTDLDMLIGILNSM